jgi:hypothetical protein
MAIKMAPIGQPAQTAVGYQLDIPQQRIVTPRNSVIVTRNSGNVTLPDRIEQLEARVVALEQALLLQFQKHQSRAEYMREYRSRQRERK